MKSKNIKRNIEIWNSKVWNEAYCIERMRPKYIHSFIRFMAERKFSAHFVFCVLLPLLNDCIINKIINTKVEKATKVKFMKASTMGSGIGFECRHPSVDKKEEAINYNSMAHFLFLNKNHAIFEMHSIFAKYNHHQQHPLRKHHCCISTCSDIVN